jgi:hypothetical protein
MAFQRGPNIVTNGLVLALDAGNTKSYPGSGTIWRDLSGNRNSGTLTNGPIFNSSNGGSMVFDGIDDYVLTSNSLTLSEATLSCWIKANGIQAEYDGILFSRTPSTATGLNFKPSNQLGYHWNDTAATYGWNSGLIIPNNIWCMVAVTIISTTGIAYLAQSTGLTSATNVTTHNSVSSLIFNLGRDPAFGTRFFTGDIANAMVYNRALSQQEILQNYNALKSRYNPE